MLSKLLLSATLAAACVPVAWACSGVTIPVALNLREFQKMAAAYTQRLPDRAAASKFLVCVFEQDADLAESLMLSQRRLAQPAAGEAIERAFLHYVVNQPEPKLGEEAPGAVRRLLAKYRQTLFLAQPSKAPAMPANLRELRVQGREANFDRYGRLDVVPVDLFEFERGALAYSTRNAAWMAEMAALAYFDNVEKQLRHWRFSPAGRLLDTATDTRGFLAERDGQLVLAFRGTSSLKNFLTDASVLRVRPTWASGRVHGGFAGALDTVWPQIENLLAAPGKEQRELWVTGHSLGGALAQLAALRLRKLGYRVRGVYTFGTPRLGDADFVREYDQALAGLSFPHVNNQDVVTRVPPGFLPAAQGKILQFAGAGHAITKLDGLPESMAAGWLNDVTESLRKATAFLPSSLRAPLFRQSGGVAPQFVYSASFEKGMLDEHGSFEYLFKLVCAVIETDYWKTEAKQAGVPWEKLTQRHRH